MNVKSLADDRLYLLGYMCEEILNFVDEKYNKSAFEFDGIKITSTTTGRMEIYIDGIKVFEEDARGNVKMLFGGSWPKKIAVKLYKSIPHHTYTEDIEALEEMYLKYVPAGDNSFQECLQRYNNRVKMTDETHKIGKRKTRALKFYQDEDFQYSSCSDAEEFDWPDDYDYTWLATFKMALFDRLDSLYTNENQQYDARIEQKAANFINNWKKQYKKEGG